MPEGHLIHRQAAWINRNFSARPVRVSSPQGRFGGAGLIDGTYLQEAFAHGKHLFVGFADEAELAPSRWVHVHLGLYGKWRFQDRAAAAEAGLKGSERLRLEGNGMVADLTGPNRCELLDHGEVAAIRSRLGPDPLHPEPDSEADFVAKVRERSVKIGQLVLDQSVVSGPGNIYRAECLFRVGISPHRLGKMTSPKRLRMLWRDLCESMERGVREGIIVTVAPEHAPSPPLDGDPEASRFYVYHRTGRPCLKCSSPVREALMQGRRLFWCSNCQR